MAFTVADITDSAVFVLNKIKRNKRPEDIIIHTTNKPLLRRLLEKKQEYRAGDPNWQEQVQGALMSASASSYVGIAGDDTVTFVSPGAAVLTQFAFKWMVAPFVLNRDDLLKFGIHVARGKATPTPNEVENLAGYIETKQRDYEESKAINRNEMLWGDGTADSKAIAGMKSIITDDPTAGSCGGIARTNAWWQHIARTGVGGAEAKVAYSRTNQTLTASLDTDFRRLHAYGGMPDVWLAGGDYIDAVKAEMRAAGQQTVTGWWDKKNNILIKGIKVGNYEIEWDPTMDARGDGKRLYAFDSRKIVLRPMAREWDNVEPRNEPMDQFLYPITTTDRGTLSQNQPDSCLVHLLE